MPLPFWETKKSSKENWKKVYILKQNYIPLELSRKSSISSIIKVNFGVNISSNKN